jgi:hypothetical protein
METDVKDDKHLSNLVKRHGGVLGLCSVVYSCPYDVSCSFLPDTVTYLCSYINDPVPIKVIYFDLKNS